MAQTAVKDFVKIPKQEYNLLKEVFFQPKETIIFIVNVTVSIERFLIFQFGCWAVAVFHS